MIIIKEEKFGFSLESILALIFKRILLYLSTTCGLTQPLLFHTGFCSLQGSILKKNTIRVARFAVG